MSTRWKTFLACLLSAVICGLLIAIDCRNLSWDRNCHIRAFQDIPRSLVVTYFWRDLLHWVNWLPGLVFGLAYAVVHFRKKNQIILFALSSGCSFLIAGLVSSYVDPFLIYGFIEGGLLGALALLLTEKFLTRSRIKADDIIRISVTSIIASGALGLFHLFYYFACLSASLSGSGVDCGDDIIPVIVQFSLVIAIWQVPVGLSLSKSLEEHTIAKGEETSASA